MRDDRQGSKRTNRNSRLVSLLNERIGYRIVHFQSTRFSPPRRSLPNFSSPPFFFFFSLPLRSREVVEPILIRLRAVEKRAPGPKVRDRSREFLYLTGILIYKYAPAFEEPSSSPSRSEFFSEVEKRTLHPAFLTRKELERGIDFLKFAPIEARLI